MAEQYFVFILIGIIILQAVERLFFAEQMHSEINKLLSKLTATVLSKNVSEYKEVVKADQKTHEKKEAPTDEVNLADADDEVFDKFIKSQTQ